MKGFYLLVAVWAGTLLFIAAQNEAYNTRCKDGSTHCHSGAR